MSDNIQEQIASLQTKLDDEYKAKFGENAQAPILKNFIEPEKYIKKCYVCGSEEIYKTDGKGPLCESCAELKLKNRLSFTTDENGKRIFDITNIKGTIRRNSDSRPGDFIIDGKKKYEIQKDFSFKRIDKN
jgi:hypothetical protein